MSRGFGWDEGGPPTVADAINAVEETVSAAVLSAQTEACRALSAENERLRTQLKLRDQACVLGGEEVRRQRARADAALVEVERLQGLIVTGVYPPNTGTFAPLVWTEEA
jgi:hypothetical protein